jgi:hypothetical protein
MTDAFLDCNAFIELGNIVTEMSMVKGLTNLTKLNFYHHEAIAKRLTRIADQWFWGVSTPLI